MGANNVELHPAEASDADNHDAGPTSSSKSKSNRRKAVRARAAQKKNPAQKAGLTNPNLQFGQYDMAIQQAYFKEILNKHDPKLSNIEATEYPFDRTYLHNMKGAYASILQHHEERRPATPAGVPKVRGPQIGLAELTHTALKETVEDLQFDAAHPSLKMNGAPAILVITADAGRAAALCTELALLLDPNGKLPSAKSSSPSGTKGKSSKHDKQNKSSGAGGSDSKPKVAKLFGRHFKVDEQRSHLRSTPAPIAVGTPARLRALLQPVEPGLTTPSKQKGGAKGKGKDKSGSRIAAATSISSSLPASASSGSSEPGPSGQPTPALNLDQLEYIILDISFRDNRKRNLLESDDARPEVLQLLKELLAYRKRRAAEERAKTDAAAQTAEEASSATTGEKRKAGELEGGEGDGEGPAAKKRKKTELVSMPSRPEEDRRQRTLSLADWLVMF
ncbi:hypothetical protein V8E36_008948 [Tilletia maclaganii]